MSHSLQDALRGLFAKAKMPSSPVIAARILELAEDPSSTIDQFADLIQMDPALAARLLKITNSAACGQRHEVTTIQRAVSLLGINRVRTLSLGFQLVGHLDRLGNCPFDMRKFWQHSLLRACLAREFADASVPSGADEAFLIGLLQDCGTLLLAQLLGEEYAELCQNEDLSPAAAFEAENRIHPYNHADASAAFAREWKLPEVIITNVAGHHTKPPLVPSPTDADRLRSLTYLIGSIPLTTSGHVGSAEPLLGQFAELHLGMNAEAVQKALAAAGEVYAGMGGLLDGAVPDDLDVTDLLSRANDCLTMTMESERRQSSEQQAQLKSALGEYRERAARDPLTGILNRGALNDAVGECVQQARSAGEAMTVLFLDLDDFKRLNDTFGHRAGDEVLQAIAETLKGCVPNAGVVGRYGGEEFLLAVSGLREADARALADEVLAGVRGTRYPGLGLPGPVTCSLGAVYGVPDAGTTVEGLVQAADELMYQAKYAGKNCYRFRTLEDVYNVDLLESDRATTDACAAAVNKGTRTRSEAVLPEEYQRIADKLDRGMLQRFLNLRKSARKQFFAPCTITSLAGASLELEAESGYVRNMSTGGIGILTTRSILRGRPVEIALLTASGETRLYVAGIVAFWRHAEGAIHEIGVQLFTHAKEPILSADPVSAIRNLDWVAQAVRSAKLAAPVPA